MLDDQLSEITVCLTKSQEMELKRLKTEIEKSGNHVSISKLVSDSVQIMLSFYRDDVLRNYKFNKYIKK